MWRIRRFFGEKASRTLARELSGFALQTGDYGVLPAAEPDDMLDVDDMGPVRFVPGILLRIKWRRL
jgi:hypothetical protein